MKEIQDILSQYEQIPPSTERTALATVIRVEGSSYRRTGARMLIRESGQWTGGISGGCLEGDALRRAKQAILQNKAAIVTYDTTQDDGHQIGVGLGCNGIIDVLLAPLQTLAHDPISILSKCVAERREHVVLTLTSLENAAENVPPGSMFHFSEGHDGQSVFPFPDLQNQVAASVAQAFSTRQSSMASFQSERFGQVSFFVEYLPPPVHLVLCGGQYDVYPMASLAKAIGWKVSVVANPAKLNRSIFQTADHIIPNQTDWLAAAQPDPRTALVLMAHDFATDKRNLATAAAAATPPPYIGILGPRKRFEKMNGELAAEGIVEFTGEFKARLFNPIGLDVGATTPEGIAVAILAEVQAVFSGRQGGFLRERGLPINAD